MDEANTRPNGNTAGMDTLAELGAVLRDLREKKGLTLDEVSADTYIRQNFLEGIENGDFSRFKALVYARGFVRSYAEYLGAPELWDDYSPVLTLENFEPAKLEEESKRKYRAPEQQISMMLPSSARAGIGVNQPARGFRQSSVRRNCIIALVLILLASSAALLFNWEKIQSEIASVQSRQAYDSVKNREAEQALHDEKVKAEEEAVAQELREQSEAAADTSPETEPAPEPDPEPPAPKPELTIRATGDCWMRVSSGESKIFEGVVKNGWERTFPLDAELTVRYGRGQSIRVSTNGTDFVSPGTGVQRYRYGTDGSATKVAK